MDRAAFSVYKKSKNRNSSILCWLPGRHLGGGPRSKVLLTSKKGSSTISLCINSVFIIFWKLSGGISTFCPGRRTPSLRHWE